MNKKSPTPLDKSKNPRKNYLTGLSLTEILVSAVIFSLVALGLTNVFVSGKRQIVHSRARMTMGEFGKYCLDPLQMDVRQDTWYQLSNRLRLGNYRSNLTNPYPFSQYSSYTPVTWLEEPLIDNIQYYPVYQVTSVGNLRKVKFTISWNEPQP